MLTILAAFIAGYAVGKFPTAWIMHRLWRALYKAPPEGGWFGWAWAPGALKPYAAAWRDNGAPWRAATRYEAARYRAHCWVGRFW